LGEAWFARADASRLWVTMHDCSEYQLWGGYYASLYVSKGDGKSRAISRPTYQSALLEAHATTAGYMRGVHFTGGDRFEEGKQHNNNPGVYNVDYWYPGIARDANTGLNTFEYLVSRRIKLVRLPFRWERIQPTLNGPLSTAELQRYKASVRSAGAAGLKVVVDCHNYGGYCTSTGRNVLNTEALPISAFIDLWRRLSEAFEDDPAVVAYDLMNEPYTYGGINAGRHSSPAKAWESAAQKAVNIIRARGERKKIMVPTYGPVPKVAESHDGPWITGGNIAYTSHHYFDHWFGPDTGGGNYALSYDDENAYYASRG
ncbi:MAG: glycoside hydrolase family 5 protein, partial [Actinomycetota bacterium]|nr:glycoside hydrolase family 5 protein [Actinomycetota bacterium]